ncbi:hypothetical protein CFC21_081772 [Triticum aestivum]|uniref:Protein kinase domain-containing protein n=3 Tax=Triticum aestivum TaxID=4565 RepID=A0A9R1L4A7_WHEAT|nr:hypothetical protein CFC21_081772 [Triticum aestivum]
MLHELHIKIWFASCVNLVVSSSWQDMDRARVAPRPLPFHLLEEITDGFSEERKLGAGAYGSVYKGQHKNGEIIAIKKLHSMPELNNQQFQKEYLNLATLQHQNIVRLLGYCHETRGEYIEFNGRTIFAENQHMALCFEYMCNGSLDNCLQDESSGHDWKTRYKIIKGICKGLKYLHEELNPPVYHLDLKPANILLDEQMNPKIADFGLSKFFGDERTRVSASAIGTIGYLPPEYINSSLVSNKLDVFSLGVIIIKTMTGRLGYSQSAEMPSEEFIDLVQEKWKNRIQGASTDDIDSCAELVKTCIKIALNCVDADRHKRPNIGDIIRELDETEIMTQFSQALTIDTGSTSLDEQDESGFLEVHPHQLRFPFFELNKAICPLLLSNSTEDNVAFRILSENHMEELSELSGVVPPRSTQTYWLVMKKQPPANTSEFAVTLESCIAHEDIADGDDQFLPEVLELTQGNKVHKVTLMAVTSERTRSGVTKVIYRVDAAVPVDHHLTQIDVHPTEPWILASHRRGGVSIWNYETQERVMRLKNLAPTDMMRSVKFIARKRWFMAGDFHGWIHVHSFAMNDEVTKFKGHDGVVISLVVHPSDPLVVSSSVDRHIKLWNWEAGWRCVRKLKAHLNNVEKVVFNPWDSNCLASVGMDNMLKIWKISSPLPVTVLDCDEHQLTVDYFHPGGDRQYIVTGSVSGKARIWDVKTNTCIRQISGLQTDNSRCVGVVRPDCPLLVMTLQGNVTSLYNFDTDCYENSIDFKLGDVLNFAYAEGIKSVVIGFFGGIAMMKIN